MKSTPKNQGAALIITLAMIAMLTFLVVAFFSRTLTNLQVSSASTGATRAAILARSAGGIIVSDIKSEIISGSTATGSATQGYVYTPTAPATAVPSLKRSTTVGYNPVIFKNLVKQSVGSFYNPAAANYNANVKPIIQAVTSDTTDILSANGRTVALERWDTPAGYNIYLPLGEGPQLLVDIDPTKPITYGRFYKSDALPRWVVMTRQGVPVSQTWSDNWKNYTTNNPNAAIGRFAFNVYDVSGLLDVNVAGFNETSDTTAPIVMAAGQKGTLGLAALSLLPGMGSSTADQMANAAKFVKAWRNRASAGTDTDYLAYLGFSRLGTTDLLGSTFSMLGPKTGFMRMATVPSAGDNRVLGRQDLIRLALKAPTASPPYGLSKVTMPYLTTFSREVNAPSWSPTQDSSAMGGNAAYPYKTNKDNATAANRFFPNVRVAAGSTWRRLTGELAVAGEPLIKYRFPLSWLALLQDADPTSNTWDLTPEATAIVNTVSARNVANGGPGLPGTTANDQAAWLVGRAFGLSWDQTNHRWRYTGSLASGLTTAPTLPYPKPTTPAGIEAPIIELLGDAASPMTVCNESREPNFFELLKAGILSGSLGNSSDYESMCVTAAEDGFPDNQIMQIGANIIDQADTDSYPTLIAFGYKRDNPSIITAVRSTTTNPAPYTAAGDVKVIAGVEDIPYLNTVLCTPYRIPAGQKNLYPAIPMPDGAQNANRDSLDCWAQFVLWKPQQQAATTKLPPGFRILYTVSSGFNTHLTYFPDKSQTTTFNGVDFHTTGIDSSPGLSAGTYVTFKDTATDFRTPTLLGGMSGTSVHGFLASQLEGSGTNPQMPSGSAQLPRGMWLGEMYRPEKTNQAGYATAPTTQHVEFRCYADSRFELQYDQDGSKNWRTYQIYNRFGVGTGGPSGYGTRSLYGYADNPTEDGKRTSPVGPTAALPAYCALDVAVLGISAIDPRSQRFGLLAQYLDTGTTYPVPQMIPKGNWNYYLKQGWSPIGAGPSYSMCFGPSSSDTRFASANWNGGTRDNPWASHSTDITIPDATSLWADNSATAYGGKTYSYTDMDGVKRRADGDSPSSVRPIQLTYPAATANMTDLGRVLNRPFRSVGELAYAFRDEPYKSLNLFTATSADSALLDLFSVSDEPAVVAGKVNLNTRNPEVLQAIIAGAAREELSSTNLINSTDALNIATLLANSTMNGTTPIPMLNQAEIASRLDTIMPLDKTNPDLRIKARREVVGRALSGSGQTRTWNFLVDVVAQSGRYGPSATASSQFVVEGEQRYWLHVAVDRYTGQVVDEQFENVIE